MDHSTYEIILFVGVLMSFVASLSAIGISMFRDEYRERRLKYIEEELKKSITETKFLRAENGFFKDRLTLIEQENRDKDKQIQALQVENKALRIEIGELRRQMRPGTLQ